MSCEANVNSLDSFSIIVEQILDDTPHDCAVGSQSLMDEDVPWIIGRGKPALEAFSGSMCRGLGSLLSL